MCESVVNARRKKIGETSALVLWWQPNFQWACSMSPEKQREKTRTLIVHKGGVSAHHNHHWYRFVVLIISSTSVWIRINAISDPKIHQDRDPFHVINFVLSIEIVDRYKKIHLDLDSVFYVILGADPSGYNGRRLGLGPSRWPPVDRR